MTFFGHNIKMRGGFEESCVRYILSDELLDMLSETKIENLPIDMVKMPYPIIFIEINDKINEEYTVVGIIAISSSRKSDYDFKTFVSDNDEKNEERLMELYPIYKIKGVLGMPVAFVVRPMQDGNTIIDINFDWTTPTKNPEDVGMHEDHPLVKKASYYCWMITALTCIYVTSNDADIVLGINTKEYKKNVKKKKPRLGKITQLRNTRYLGNNIKIDRKFQVRKTSGVGTHASPCPHWRSGHFRHLGNGKVVWVRPCIIGFGKEKQIPKFKKYIVE